MRADTFFLLSDAALRSVIDRVQPGDFDKPVPASWSSFENPTVRDLLRSHAYDEAWVPAVLAGKSVADGDELRDKDLLGDDPIAAYGALNDAATELVQRGVDVDHTGHVKLLSSVSARLGHVGQANCTAAKAGLEGFVRTVSQEYASRFRINIVSPGPTRTDMFTDASAEAQETMQQATPMRRVAEPQEIADVVFWVSQSTFMTGATVPVSGGIVI